MKASTVGALAIFIAACGPRDAAKPETSGLRLVVGDAPIAIEAGQTLVLQLLVLGAGTSAVTIESPDLPPFASLQGSLLTLSPGRQFEGDYAMTLVAKAGSSSASAIVEVHVARYNTAPTVGPTLLANADSFCLVMGATNPCAVQGTPAVWVMAGDADGDAVTVDVEVVPDGQAFSRTPTHSVTAPVGVGQNAHCYDGLPNEVCVEVELTGLPPGPYAFALRVRDAFGTIATWGQWTTPVDGWVNTPGFRFIGAP